MRRSFFILLLCFATTLQAKDFALLKQLPHRLSEAQKQGHKGWDSGNTATMREATYRYNEALVAMIKDLAKTYYPKGFLSADQADEYLKALYTKNRFKESAANPTGEFQGTMTYLDVPADVGKDLEEAISDMVQAITAADSGFDYQQWRKDWEQALHPAQSGGARELYDSANNMDADADKDLNVSYQKLIRRIREEHSSEKDRADLVIERLRESQRAWLKYRDAQIGFIGVYTEIGSSSARAAGLSTYNVELTKERI